MQNNLQFFFCSESGDPGGGQGDEDFEERLSESISRSLSCSDLEAASYGKPNDGLLASAEGLSADGVEE